MPIEEIIKFLRQSVMVQDPEVSVVDKDFLTMKDEDFIGLLQISLAKINPEEDLTDLDSEYLYPLILLSKKELYHRLALKFAPKYTIISSSGATLQKSDIFDHYYKLIQEVEDEYKFFISNGGTGLGGGVPVIQGEVLLSSRYFSNRNYSLASKPSVKAKIDNVYTDSVELSWSIKKINKFARYEVYIGTTPVIDKYKNYEVSKEAKKVSTVEDIHSTCTRIVGLVPDTKYYIAVLVIERNGLKGYKELDFTTLSEEE